MKKILFLFVVFVVTVFAKVDYSAMSTEELLAMMGYVSPKNRSKFETELKSRVKNMNSKERKIYFRNLKKVSK